MKAEDLKVGARFDSATNPDTSYVVQEVVIDNPPGIVKALVRYDVDGGNGVRTWGTDQNIPLVNPE